MIVNVGFFLESWKEEMDAEKTKPPFLFSTTAPAGNFTSVGLNIHAAGHAGFQLAFRSPGISFPTSPAESYLWHHVELDKPQDPVQPVADPAIWPDLAGRGLVYPRH